jgi:hypothetical protein
VAAVVHEVGAWESKWLNGTEYQFQNFVCCGMPVSVRKRGMSVESFEPGTKLAVNGGGLRERTESAVTCKGERHE